MHLAKNMSLEFNMKYRLNMLCKYQRKSYLYAHNAGYVQTISAKNVVNILSCVSKFTREWWFVCDSSENSQWPRFVDAIFGHVLVQ